MTAVARLQVDGWPLLFEDLLVSAPKKQGSQVTLPGVDVVHHSAAVRGAHGLHQKIAIVSDNILIGWAGKYSAASDVIGELKLRCEYERFSSKDIAQYLRGQRKSVWKEIGLAGFVFDSDTNNLATFGCACRTLKTDGLGEIGLLGTGSDMLREYFQQDFIVPTCPQDPENLAIGAVGYGMAAAANFLTMEQFACESLDNLFGGGYEIATRSFGKFVKLTDVLYAFWRGNLDSEHSSVTLKALPFLLLRFEYYSDLLVIRAVALNENNGVVNTRETLFPVPPVYRYLTAEERASPPVPKLRSSWLCNYVQIVPQPDRMDILTVAKYAPKAESLHFEERNGRLVGLTVSDDLYKEILMSIENHHGRAA